ncbi:unnamed protein product [Notodromas monacha]|uniref:Uncharacterized protein n=1 Tax=Notodromas monacha TaxID=399045 RepID=A0A7R9BS29_9CRUS|nr:unnamed protein product [Notodromas monacha]CAG0920659.1 unnamed protein product [Notodromas monacha]
MGVRVGASLGTECSSCGSLQVDASKFPSAPARRAALFISATRAAAAAAAKASCTKDPSYCKPDQNPDLPFTSCMDSFSITGPTAADGPNIGLLFLLGVAECASTATTTNAEPIENSTDGPTESTDIIYVEEPRSETLIEVETVPDGSTKENPTPDLLSDAAEPLSLIGDNNEVADLEPSEFFLLPFFGIGRGYGGYGGYGRYGRGYGYGGYGRGFGFGRRRRYRPFGPFGGAGLGRGFRGGFGRGFGRGGGFGLFG